ncbi:peroxisome biogenesis factor 2 isoform X2 [Tribolium castaneum]|uniref:peroxisome biogenesis factor 2 isoform X2 n=1 Tax=Tribolium castaneum TaxID=7070 RepID=UPI0030FEA768
MSNDKLLRVTQMNAIFLDNEIYKALMRILHETSRFLPPGYIAPIEPELGLIVRLALLKNSVCRNESTFGQQLLSIKYSNMSNFKKILYLFGNCFDYVKHRLEFWKPSHKVNTFMFKIHMVLVLLNFINMSIFLRRGVKPLLIERCLGLNQEYSTKTAPRHFEAKYLSRELLWNGFIDVLIHIIPLINYHKIKRTMRHFNPFHKKPTYVVLNSRTMTMHSKCAHCGENPILPHHMGCAHVFCYVCLKKKLYFLLEQLQNMARDLPPKYQMRLPYELLSSLANCLLNDTVFEIVKGLLEIQHVTEQHLYQQRLQFINNQKLKEHEILNRYIGDPDKKVEELRKLMLTQKDELKQFDMGLVIQLDQKVADQQQVLEQAGVPGFYVTKNAVEIKVQMHLLDFMLRLSKMTLPS